MRIERFQLTADMISFLKDSIGDLMYSFSVEDTELNRDSENHFLNYLTSAVSMKKHDFVLFNEIKIVEGQNNFLFKFKKQKAQVCLSIVKDSVEPEKVDGVFDVQVGEKISDIEIVSDNVDCFRHDRQISKYISDIAIIISLETKKLVFQRAERWADNLSVDIYNIDEENVFYLSMKYSPEEKDVGVEVSRKIVSVKDL